MADNAALIGDIPLNQLAIPGTHDSGTFTITGSDAISPDNPSIFLTNLVPGVIASWSKAQGVGFTQQLNAGIRYLDVRVCSSVSGQLYFCHGFYGPTIASMVVEVTAFLAAHPKEVVILDFNHFAAVTPDQHTLLASQLVAAFGTSLIPSSTDPKVATLNQLWAGSGRVIVFYGVDGTDNSTIAGYVSGNSSLLWTGDARKIVSAWPEAAGWDTLNARIFANLVCRCDTVHGGSDPDNSRFFVAQAQSTPDPPYIIGQTLIPLGFGEGGLEDLANDRNVVQNVWDYINTLNTCPSPGGRICGNGNIIINDWFHETNLVEMVKAVNTDQSPAKLLRAWANDNRFMWAASSTGTFFGDRDAAQVNSLQNGPETTLYAPAVASLGDRVVAVWTNFDRLNAFSWSPGGFFNRVNISDVLNLENTQIPTALASFNGKVFLAWIAQDNHLAFLSSADGVNWARTATLPQQVDSIPAVAAFNGRLYVAYLGGGNQLEIMSSADGANFSAPQQLGVYSDWGPGLTSFQGRLYMAWKGNNSQLQVWSSADGRIFDRRASMADQTDRNPALSVFRGRLALGWIGTDDRPNIMHSSDGQTFVDKVTDLGKDAGGHDMRANGLSLLAWPPASFIDSVVTADGQPYSAGVWTNQAVRVRFTCDSGAGGAAVSVLGGIPTGVPNEVLFSSDGDGQSVSAACTDAAGTSPPPLQVSGIRIDTVSPVIAASARTADGRQYTAGAPTSQNVIVTFSCTDALSGVATVDPPVTVSGAESSVTGRCTDKAGNTASVDFGPVSIFRDGPSVTASATNIAGQPYVAGAWTNYTVVVNFTCNSPVGIAIQAGAAVVTAEGVTDKVTGTCVDTAGNTSSLDFGPILISRTLPTIQASATTADGRTYAGNWTNQTVTVRFSCAAGIAGLARVDGPITVSGEGSALSAAGACVDNAGNRAVANFSPIRIDRTPPASRISPLPTTEASPGFVVQWTGSDAGSGIQDFTVYVSDSGGPFLAWLTRTTGTQATYSGQSGHAYGFYSIARDLAGNIEGSKTAAETSTQIAVVGSLPQIVVTESLHRDSQNNVVANVTLANTGGTTAQATVITVAKTGSISAASLPTSAVNIAAGSSASLTLVFPPSVGAPNTNTALTVGGTYVGGSFNFTSRITLP